MAYCAGSTRSASRSLRCDPTVQGELLEAARKLHVTADGFPGVVHAKADQEDLEPIADKAQHVEHDTLLSIGPGEDVVDLVDDQHLDADSLHDAHGRLFHLRDVGPRCLGRAEEGKQFTIESLLAGAADHFHGQDRCLQNPGPASDMWWILIAEALHDHGLAHPAVAIDRDRRHAGASRMIEKRLKAIEGLLRAGIWGRHFHSEGLTAGRVRSLHLHQAASSRIFPVLAHQSERAAWIPCLNVSVNDCFGGKGCIAATELPRLRRLATSALTSSA